MKNVEMTVEGTMLTIKVDLSKEFGPSASGKTIIIASTEGNVTIPSREEKSRAERVPEKMTSLSFEGGEPHVKSRHWRKQ